MLFLLTGSYGSTRSRWRVSMPRRAALLFKPLRLNQIQISLAHSFNAPKGGIVVLKASSASMQKTMGSQFQCPEGR